MTDFHGNRFWSPKTKAIKADQSASSQGTHFSDRERESHQSFNDYECEVDSDDHMIDVDSCYRVACNLPQIFKEAMNSLMSEMWASANVEMNK